MMSTDAKPENITDFEDAETVRWLTDRLAPARRRILEGPGAEAVARMRALICGRILDEASHKKSGKLAA